MRYHPRSARSVRRSRRITAVAAFVVAVGLGAGAVAAAELTESGGDLSSWRTVLGDGIWTGVDEAPVSIDDIETYHHGTHSELVANVEGRGVMAHNITYHSRPEVQQLDAHHVASVEFRQPLEISTRRGRHKAQTLEVGLFVWDGLDTRMDHGFAFQWVLNPWMREFGQIRVWADSPTGPRWQGAGYLAPDTEWHTAEFEYQPTTDTAVLRIDDLEIDVAETLTPKPANWATTIAARFQVETISLWPGSSRKAPTQRAEFRNWSWTITTDD